MVETLFIKEKKKIPNIVMVIIVAVVCSILGSLVTYFLLVNKINVANNNGTTTNVTTYQIEQTDSPVVAIAKKAGPSIVGVKVQAISQNIFGSLSESASERFHGSGLPPQNRFEANPVQSPAGPDVKTPLCRCESVPSQKQPCL